MAGEHDVGRWGERVAAGFLEARGWRVLARNYRDGPRELDLVVRRGGTTAFVEVKTRSGSTDNALRAITPRKRLDVARAASRWVVENRGSSVEYRFDVVIVRFGEGGDADVLHLPDAWGH